ncbi:succinate-semialdehyde dehydrogenase / glutarate-semialdehyde dehydrogenase [Saccharicrinis carchari]|uniref:Succinate-semialdehyde dehydrogenase / glutarate-semialdehyde dehydrogenase n=1 Tax=Saccharicrinis carchari TaxID=1168039 RepID=A0A521DK92_SACCC|nr:NAD-dependent succinate-semialdehyde dehydrogenase [Saccharicrinis carchari]SMO71511.1 succinate-semialdehyde dehydrogenase / glutarate-semialdehyde dehydrogenase [Saccharicrinis carchari]
MVLKSINPANGELIGEYTEFNAEQFGNIVDRVNRSFKTWSKTGLHRRIDHVKNLADLLSVNKEKLAAIITNEMGKNIAEARAEIDKCAWLCHYYCENIDDFLKVKPIQTDASESYISFRPLGVILAIMPWNFPFWQVFRCAIPTLLAGNTMLLKHASNVSACALAIEELFREADFPNDVFRTVLVSGQKVEKMIAHKSIAAVTLTGSDKAGRSVAQSAGSHLKKCVLELGGSDPYIILDDADLDLAVQTCVKGRLLNAGQSCIGAKRFIATPKIYDRFKAEFVREMKKASMGNPFDENKQLGPLARNDIREDLIAQVNESLNMGAQLLCGGLVNYDDKGFYYPATVLSNVQPGMPAYHQEMFGPVAALIKAKDETDTIKIANDTSFGLGAAVFTSDIEKGRYLAEFELEAGCCFVNDFVKSDPRLPFGGIKESGYGRELSIYGAHEFMNIKTVYIK